MGKYLIIGGAGFIGSHLCEALLAAGNNVVVIDDFSTGAMKDVDPKINMHNANIDDADEVARIFEQEKPDVVYHLAGAINLRRPIKDPLFLKSLNVLGRTKIILDACKATQVKKLVFISSGGAIYENANQVPTDEQYPAHPTSLYGLVNLATEKYIELFSKSHNLPYVILRLSNVYGPRQWETGIIPSLIMHLLRKESPTINGDGTQTRDFIYIEDVVEACMMAVNGAGITGIYNVGSQQEVSLNEIFESVKRILDEPGTKAIYQTSVLQESKRSALDIQKIKQEINWQPNVSLQEGLKKTIAWFKNK